VPTQVADVLNHGVEPVRRPSRKEVDVSASDQLSKLAARAKEAEDHAAAARAKAKTDLEQDVETARASAQAQAETLREKADASKGDISDWWSDIQSNWNQHIAVVHANVESKRAEHDLAKAERNAEIAEDDAMFAIDYAYGAIEEAEYAVLDAVLTRKEAEELSAGAGTSA
jgi:hypothetical protein